MSNSLDIGTSSGGNALYIGSIIYVGSAVGTSTANGLVIGVGNCTGVSSGSSLAVGQALSNGVVGIATGTSYVNGAGYLVANGIGATYGTSLVAGISLTNRAIGLAAGTSLAQYLVQFAGSAVGTSTVIGVADAASKFKPLDLFVGYSSDGTSITIPISSVIGLTAAEADTVTGDWREVLQAILLRAVEHHRSFTWSEQLRTYNAFGMNMLTNSTYDRYFTTTFYTHQCGSNVVQEP